MLKQAFIFDLNGTIINDMPFHSDAWYHVLNNYLRANLSREEVNAQMYGKNEELLIRIFGKEKFTREEIHHLSVNKEKIYQEKYRPHMQLLPGLDKFLDGTKKHNIKTAIGTAAIQYNVDYILDGLNLHKYFDCVVSADDVHTSKPDPETFIKCATSLSVNPKDCLVFEDSPKGIQAALLAGMHAVAVTTGHDESTFSQYENVVMCICDYTDARLRQLFQL